jgi:hypothetical protein
MVKNLSQYRRQKSEIPEHVQVEMGRLLVFMLKEIIKIKNKYNYKVPLLILEHRTFKKNEEFTSASILRVNEDFLETIIPKL